MGRLRRPRGRQWLVGPFVVLALLLGSATVRAATDKREIEARADFAAGRYQQAIDLFAQLYGESLNPIYLRNIGRCQQGLNEPQAAIKSFREYLKKAKGLKPDERAEIEGYIKEMETMLAAQQPAASPPPATAPLLPAAPPPVATQPTPAAAPPPAAQLPAAAAPVAGPGAPAAAPQSVGAVAPPAPVVSVPASPEAGTVPMVSSSSPPATQVVHPWRVPGIVVTVVGAALVGTGVALGVSARNDADAVSASYDPSQADAGKRNAKLGAAADIVGAAAVVTGIVLITHAVNAPTPAVFGLRAGAVADSRSGLLLLGGTF